MKRIRATGQLSVHNMGGAWAGSVDTAMVTFNSLGFGVKLVPERLAKDANIVVKLSNGADSHTHYGDTLKANFPAHQLHGRARTLSDKKGIYFAAVFLPGKIENVTPKQKEVIILHELIHAGGLNGLFPDGSQAPNDDHDSVGIMYPQMMVKGDGFRVSARQRSGPDDTCQGRPTDDLQNANDLVAGRLQKGLIHPQENELFGFREDWDAAVPGNRPRCRWSGVFAKRAWKVYGRAAPRPDEQTAIALEDAAIEQHVRLSILTTTGEPNKMSYKLFTNCLFTIAILFLALTTVRSQEINTADSNPSGENVILQWNRVLQETIRTPGQQPATIFPVRSFAMMHAAMFDAVNSIDGTYTPYLTDVPGSQRASQEAAAAKAAHDVLAALYPTRQSIFAAELANSLNGIPWFRSSQGVRVGEIVAARLLAARANDGWSITPPPFVLPATPGNWQPAPAPAGFTQYPAVVPFATTSSTQFAPNPPPSLTSAEYAAALNEIKEIGSATSTTRTADQTKVAQLWANVNTPTSVWFVWNNVARTVAGSRNRTTVENARLFALMNIAFHDALQTTMASKFVHGLWRPATAIRRADEDGNPDTTQDANWTSLIGNPPYPAYAGNHAAIGTSQATVLALFLGRDDIRFEHTWDGAGGATRSYPGFTAMANEEERSRVYGGIHFTFDQTAGQAVGRNVANYVFQNFMRPRGCDR